MRLHVLEGKDFTRAPIEVAVMDSPGGLAWRTQQPLVVPDVTVETRFSPEMNFLRDKGIRSYCALPLTTVEKRLGALGLGSSRVSAYSEKNQPLLLRGARQLALAVEDALTRRTLQEQEEPVARPP